MNRTGNAFLAFLFSALLGALVSSNLVDANPRVAPAAYRVQEEGTDLAVEQKLNFAGTSVTCVDDAVNFRTTCTVTGGGATPPFGLADGGVDGVLPIANGGTNTSATPTAGTIPYGTGTALAYSAVGAAGDCFKSGAAGAPTWGSCSSISAYGTVMDEAVNLTQRTTIDFTGAGVTCFDDGGVSRTVCDIPGSAGGGISYAEAAAAVLAGF
jgi:hypothetical protein